MDLFTKSNLVSIGLLTLVSCTNTVDPQLVERTELASASTYQAAGNPVSGTYVSDFTSGHGGYLGSKYEKLILTLEQNGNQISATDSRKKIRIFGAADNGVINFEVLPSAATGFNGVRGQWTIENNTGNLKGAWAGDQHDENGKWNLRRIDSHGVELYTVDAGTNRPFKISESTELFNTVFNTSSNQNVVFYIHGRGEDIGAEFEATRLPKVEEYSNTRFVMISWLSWGGPGVRPYQHAVNAASGLSDFLLAFNEFKSRNPGSVGDRKITLLAYSMGNIPLKEFIEELYEDRTFPVDLLDAVILVSADVPVNGHRKWIERIDFSKSVTIVQNGKDLVLSLSTFVGEEEPAERGPRLGKGFDASTYTHLEDLAHNATYLDVTRSSSFDHRAFDITSYPLDTNAIHLFNLLLNGQELDTQNSAMGLYQEPELSPVFYFHSSENQNEKTSSETPEDLTKSMSEYIKFRASQLYSERHRNPEFVQTHSSEEVYSITGDWRLAKGEWQTTWDASGATLIIVDDTRVKYNFRNGRILFYSIDTQGRWEGYWIEDTGRSACGSDKKDGSSYWGKVKFHFNEVYTSFKGTWDYCGKGKKTTWRGYR